MTFGMNKSKQTPVDMTPAPFANLQGPFADVIARLIGGGSGPVGGPGTIYGPGTGTAGTPGTPGRVTSGTSAPGAPGGVTGGIPAHGSPSNLFSTGQYGRGQVIGAPDTNWTSGDRQGMPMRPQTGGVNPGGNMNGTPGQLTGGTPGTMGTNPNNILGGIPYYQGPLVAQMTPQEKALLAKLGGQTSNPNGGTGSDASNYLLDVIGGNYLPGQPGANPFMDAAIREAQRPTMEGLTETLTRDLPGRFTSAGQMIQPQGSSAFDRAAAIASKGATDAMAGIATNMSFQGYESERGRQQDAAKSMPGVTRQEVDTTIESLKAAALPRLIQDLGIERGIEEFNNRVNNLLTTLGIAGGVTRPVIAQEGKSSGFNAGIPMNK